MIQPPPINETIIEQGRGTIPFIRHLLDISDTTNKNTSNIATNTSDIAMNRLNISSNLTKINTNTTNISNNTTNIANNLTKINTNIDNISSNLTKINTNILDIATNKTNISTNTDSITSMTIKTILTTADITLTAKNQNILCDATNADINVYLPTSASCYINSISFAINVSKIDSSSNTVTINPQSGEKVGGADTQTLSNQNDVINLITDGNNWYFI